MEQLKINMVDGVSYGDLLLKADTKGRKKSSASLTLEHNGSEGSISLDASTTKTPLCGTVVDSTAIDVAGVVADLNTLLAALRTANIVG